MAENDGECPRDLKEIITEIGTVYNFRSWYTVRTDTYFEAFADFEQGRWLGTDLERFSWPNHYSSCPDGYASELKVQLPRCVLGLLSAQSFSRCYNAKDLIKFLGIIWYADLDSRLNSLRVASFSLLAPLYPRTRTRSNCETL